MTSSSVLFGALALLVMVPAACLMCNVGRTYTWSNGCIGKGDTGYISSTECPATRDICLTASFSQSVGPEADCTLSHVIAECASASEKCAVMDENYHGNDGYHCETCSTDDCNPRDKYEPSETSETSRAVQMAAPMTLMMLIDIAAMYKGFR
mmetsp:Transcript_22750/g.53087  ORF Transcript_22750/g.53087 Transcript_22750/m.53087 type:complete len:152 (-) Transcript_22750:11-466(-)